MPRPAKTTIRQAGYTLFEMSIVLTIISLIAAGTMTITGAKAEADKRALTNERLDKIETAIQAMYAVSGYLPGPAPTDAAPDTATFGIGIQAATATGTGVFEKLSAGGVAGTDEIRIGSVPTRSLNLTNDYAFDAWGNRFDYYVVKKLTDITMTATTFGSFSTTLSTGIIKVIDTVAAPNDVIIDTTVTPKLIVAYAVVSHGKTGVGAVTPRKAGSLATCPNTATDPRDGENCNKDEILRDQRMNELAGGTFYDDIIRWKLKTALTILP